MKPLSKSLYFSKIVPIVPLAPGSTPIEWAHNYEIKLLLDGCGWAALELSSCVENQIEEKSFSTQFRFKKTEIETINVE